MAELSRIPIHYLASMTLGPKYFSKLNLHSGYWQVEMKEEDKEKTAFNIGNLGFCECNRMAFSFTNAPGSFQQVPHLFR